MAEFAWKPQLKQALFMQRWEEEALYGGAAGGGKSDALLCEALRQVHIPHYRALILRDTFPQLEGLIARSYELYKAAFPKAVYNQSEKRWTFPSGAKIFFGYMQHENDKYNYQGKAYDFIGFDELTHFSKSQYEYLKSRNRPVGSGTRVYVRATANPDGKGMGWVKERFITPAPPMTTITEEEEIKMPDGKIVRKKMHRIFVPSTVFDNKKLLENDPDYLANLASLPEAQRNALLYGSWDSFMGQVFTEWKDDPAHYKDRKWTHVIEPFRVPGHWKVYRGFDWGYARPFSVGWYAVDTDGKVYRIREYYGCTNVANEGVKMDPVEVAENIKRIEGEDPNLRDRKIIGIADPAIFQSDRGESVAHMMERAPNFIYFQRGDHQRLPGKMQFHYRLAFDKNGECLFQVFNTCRNFIRTFPLLIYSTKDPEDVDSDCEDHIYDECRYVLMEHPISPKQTAAQEIRGDDPLDQRVPKNNRYEFFMV